MRRKLVAGITLLGVAAVIDLVCLRSRNAEHARPPAADRATGLPAAARAAAATARAAATASSRIDPPGALRLEGQVVDARDSQSIAGATVWLGSEPPRTATSEADGSFAFEGLLARRYVVKAWKDAHYSDPLDARVSAQSEPAILRMKVGTTLDFKLTACGTGAPIRAAQLTVDHDRTIDSDAAGIARVRGLGTFFHYIEISADGRAPAVWSAMLQTEEDGVRTIPIVLCHGVRLAGTVVDPSGQPVGDATVRVNARTYTGDTTTDARGAWTFPSLAAGTYELVASSEVLAESERTTVEVDGARPRDDVVLRLRRGTDIAGQVVDDKAAGVAHARVHLGREDGWSAASNADGEGRFAFLGVSPGTYAVFATSDTRASPVATVDGAAGAAALRLPIADAMITGIVVDDQGAPIAEVTVDAMARGTRVFAGASRDVTDSRGRFELGPLPGSTYALMAEWPGAGLENMYLHDDRITAQVGQRDVKITLPAHGAIAGRVTVRGKPLRRFAVALDDRGFFFNTANIINTADGRFVREYVPTGTWRVGIVGDDVEVHEIRDVRVAPGKRVDLGTIDLAPARRIRGRVVDASGAPVAGASVFVGALIMPERFDDKDPLEAALSGERRATAGADGRFEIALADTSDRMPAKIAAMDPSRGRSPERAVPDGSDEIVLRLAPAASIVGVVRNVRGFTMVRARSEEAGSGTAMIEGDGPFRIDGLAPGRYQVSAMGRPEQASPPVTVELAAGATATVELTLPPVAAEAGP